MSAKNNCRVVASKMEQFLDGELTPQEEQFVKEELAECSDCRVAYDRLQKLRVLVREVYVEEARTAELDDLLPGVMEKLANRPRSWQQRLSDWLERYQLGLASPVAPIGVAATFAVGIIAATLIYATSTGPSVTVSEPRPAAQVAEAGSADVQEAPADDAALASARLRTPRRPAHEERPFRKNEALITYYNAESGIVVVDVDPDGDAPAVVWHFAEDGMAAEEGNRI